MVVAIVAQLTGCGFVCNSATLPPVFEIEICARDVSQADTLKLRPLQEPLAQVHGGLNIPITQEVGASKNIHKLFRFLSHMLRPCTFNQNQYPTNYLTVSGTFETVSLIVYGHVVPPEHVSPAMAVALGDNPPAALDGRQIFPELEGSTTRLVDT